MAYHNRTHSWEQTSTYDCSDKILIMGPRAGIVVRANDQAGVLEQVVELLSERVNGPHSLKRKKVPPAVVISNLMCLSFLPTIISSDKSNVVAVTIPRKLGFC